jgi:hypothetical protein
MSGPPAGWFEDPDDPSRERWWDGEGWAPHARRLPHEQTSAGTVRGGFKFGCGFFLFVFVFLPILLIGGCAVLAGTGSDSSVIFLGWP